MAVSDFRHPQEVQRLKALQNVKLLNMVLNVFNKAYANITSFATVAERNYPVTAYTEPRLYRLYHGAKEKLGVTEDIPIYLRFDYAIAAETIGTDGDCAIIVNSCCLEELTDNELMAILARELGHIFYHHVKYINIIRFFDDLTQKLSGIAETAVLTTKNVLLEWMRCAEYTADRAAAIATGTVEAPCMAILKAMGAIPEHPQIDLDLRETVSEMLPPFPEEALGKVGQIAFQNIMSALNVPFGRLRVKELWDWSRSEVCRQKFAHIYFSNSWTFGLERYSDPLLLYSKAERILTKSPEEALALLHRAARCGSPAAMSSLGKIYLKGKLVTKDAGQAVRYLQLAVAAKYPAAYTQLGECYLNGIPEACQQNKDMGYRLIRCGRDKGDGNAQIHLLKYKHPAYSVTKCVEDTVKTKHKSGGKRDYYVLMGKQGDARKWYDYLDIPNDEKMLVLAVNQAYPGQYLAICASGIYYLTDKTLPQYCAWETLKRQNVAVKESFGRTDLMVGDRLLYSSDESTVGQTVIPLIEQIWKRLQ